MAKIELEGYEMVLLLRGFELFVYNGGISPEKIEEVSELPEEILDQFEEEFSEKAPKENEEIERYLLGILGEIKDAILNEVNAEEEDEE